MKPTLLVLAAGMGSRYGSLKQVDPLGPNGEAIIEYSVYDAIKAGFGKVIFVIRESIEEEFKQHIGNKFVGKIAVEYVFQELDNLPEGITVPEGRVKPWGTAHAMMMAEEKINEPFAVINADDFYGFESYQILGDFLRQCEVGSMDICLLGYKVANTLSRHGSVSRGVCAVDTQGDLLEVVERTEVYYKGDAIFYKDGEDEVSLDENTLVSMNMMGFTPAIFEKCRSFFKLFLAENKDNLKAEFFLPLVLSRVISEGGRVEVQSTPEKWFGVTYKEDKQGAMDSIKELIAAGKYPAALWS